MRLSDIIEEFIKGMLSPSVGEIRLQRNELAEYFSCSPSQINYVLSTRFTPAHGYIIESRRGGGGFISITQIKPKTAQQLDHLLNNLIGSSIDDRQANALCKQLLRHDIINKREARLMCAATCNKVLNVSLSNGMKDEVRANILRSMLLSLVKGNQLEEENDL